MTNAKSQALSFDRNYHHFYRFFYCCLKTSFELDFFTIYYFVVVNFAVCLFTKPRRRWNIFYYYLNNALPLRDVHRCCWTVPGDGRISSKKVLKFFPEMDFRNSVSSIYISTYNVDEILSVYTFSIFVIKLS